MRQPDIVEEPRNAVDLVIMKIYKPPMDKLENMPSW